MKLVLVLAGNNETLGRIVGEGGAGRHVAFRHAAVPLDANIGYLLYYKLALRASVLGSNAI